MVEPILYASLGALIATLLALLFLPLFWRRAVRLTTRQLINRLPVSASEIVAAQDRLRAEQAMAMRVVERKAERALSEATADRVESARARSTELGHLADLADLRAQVAALEAEGARVKGELDKSGGEAAAAYEALQEARAAADQAAREVQAARQDASASRVATDRARMEAAARESEIAALRARLTGPSPASASAPGAVSPVADFAELSARAATPAEPAAAKSSSGTAAQASPARKTDEIAPYEDAALSALRERLDEVADAVLKATETTSTTEPAPAKTRAAKSRDPMRVVSTVPVAERAGA